MTEYELVVAPHVHVEKWEADGLLCECGEILEIKWATKGLSYAECSCNKRYGYKLPYSKFVRI